MKYLQCEQALTTLPQAMREPSITACLFPPQSRSALGILGQFALILFMFLVGLERAQCVVFLVRAARAPVGLVQSS